MYSGEYILSKLEHKTESLKKLNIRTIQNSILRVIL